MIIALSKRLFITLAAVPLLLSAAPAPVQQKPCDNGCPPWGTEEMEKWFSHSFPRMNPASSAATIRESDKAYFISMDLPGVEKKDIDLQVIGNRMMISAERKDETQTKEKSERFYGSYRQSFSLPDDADLDKISAQSENGVLKIMVPKSGKKASKKIDIK